MSPVTQGIREWSYRRDKRVKNMAQTGSVTVATKRITPAVLGYTDVPMLRWKVA